MLDFRAGCYVNLFANHKGKHRTELLAVKGHRHDQERHRESDI